ncbi:hypothetical protein HDU93_003441 [Gonapodya sp. JEL0774]|nr:hypothetical protein HDU93_003441 [Gonapodya sp. JEL0774]
MALDSPPSRSSINVLLVLDSEVPALRRLVERAASLKKNGRWNYGGVFEGQRGKRRQALLEVRRKKEGKEEVVEVDASQIASAVGGVLLLPPDLKLLKNRDLEHLFAVMSTPSSRVHPALVMNVDTCFWGTILEAKSDGNNKFGQKVAPLPGSTGVEMLLGQELVRQVAGNFDVILHIKSEASGPESEVADAAVCDMILTESQGYDHQCGTPSEISRDEWISFLAVAERRNVE